MNKTLIRIVLPVILFVFVAGGWSLLLAGESRGEEASPRDLIRLHIIANSDSAADQQLKYRVRDAVTAHLAPHLAGAATVDDARRIVAGQREAILRIARSTVAAAGADYPVALETGWFEFPLRTYGTLVLPPGRYEAVRLLLGAAEGKNWWCVLFPPLCFIDGTTVTAVPAVAGADDKTASPKPEKIEIRWKLAEALGRQ
ncbi:stage II sporulation protein R [Anaeroselena agilis]|uniref:Stage II sporulation protein R n=1 Tax=Anaeroselena agilis TaxID=3063788 RepID=A0ABU3NXX7_9FIRM|nr:stage II sporulation protein R [Selenomonadales bacterium 4137-cl]